MSTNSENSNLQLDAHQVVLRPLISEKSNHLSETLNKYTFRVHPQANKIQIRNAIEELYGVRVVSVRTQNRAGKPKRYKMKPTRTTAWKKAIVSLHEEDRISFF
jgi:large subunit ribosomal protein L23